MLPNILPIRSLALRLTLYGALATLVALALAGSVVLVLQRLGAEKSFDTQLDITLGLLVGALADGRLEAGQPVIADPRYAVPGSGWYWLVRRADTAIVYASTSLIDPLPDVGDEAFLAREGGLEVATIRDTGDQRLRLVRRDIRLADTTWRFEVTGDLAAVDLLVSGFRYAVIITLFVLWLALMVLGFVQIRFGLRPLDAMRRQLVRVREGEDDTVQGQYPLEVAPLVGDLNQMLAANAAILDRARRHVGNLAHGLKTPLAVILNETRDLGVQEGTRIREQAEAMRAQISLYLDRARRAAEARKPGTVTKAAAVIEPLLRVFRKLSMDRGIRFESTVSDDILLRVEKHDLEEILGNLIENAARMAVELVCVAAKVDGAFVQLSISDDGPGIAADQREKVLERGMRLDENTPGSGLGLSIVRELVELYGGGIVLDKSDAGGLCVMVFLPAGGTGVSARVSP